VNLKRRFVGKSGFDEIDSAGADVTRDGRIDITDLVYLKRYLAQWEGYSLD
jgi:hypothetical protein